MYTVIIKHFKKAFYHIENSHNYSPSPLKKLKVNAMEI